MEWHQPKIDVTWDAIEKWKCLTLVVKGAVAEGQGP